MATAGPPTQAGAVQGGHRTAIHVGRLVLLLVVLGLWEALSRTDVLPAAFIGQPSQFLPMLVDETLSGKIAAAAVDTLSATLWPLRWAGSWHWGRRWRWRSGRR